MRILKIAAPKMTALIPSPIKVADKKPIKYSPIESVKIKIVIVPGQGTMPAATITPKSVL